MKEEPKTEVVHVCGRCRGSGLEHVDKQEKRDKPPNVLCLMCHGTGTKPKDHAEFA